MACVFHQNLERPKDFKPVLFGMEEQWNECNSCHNILRAAETSEYCIHSFCHDCLRRLAEKEYPKQGVTVDTSCSYCGRLCLHNKVDLSCPDCTTSFRYEEPLPNQHFLRLLMLIQIFICITTFFITIVWIFKGLWLKAVLFVLINGSLLFSAINFESHEVLTYRLCCEARRKKKLPVIAFLTFLAFCAVLLQWKLNSA